jgi:hypothetical protein
MDGRLVFALRRHDELGNLAGRYREMRSRVTITSRALQRGGAYWWEPTPEPDGLRAL